MLVSEAVCTLLVVVVVVAADDDADDDDGDEQQQQQQQQHDDDGQAPCQAERAHYPERRLQRDEIHLPQADIVTSGMLLLMTCEERPSPG